MNKKAVLTILIILIIVVAALYWLDSRREGGLWSYFSSQKTPSEEATTTEGAFGEFNPDNPKSTYALEEVPEKAIKINVGNKSFQPAEFTVKPGQVVSLAFEGQDEASHVIKFDDDALSNIRVVVGQYKRGISFVAPEEVGDYTFYCDVGDHREVGEQGIMHVAK